MDIREITLNGHPVTYREAGGGPPVLLIHGIAGNSRLWSPVIERLSDDAHLIAPDLLGHGESAKPRGDYSLGAFATGLRDFLMALGLDHVTIVGHSLGGGIALQFAYQFPEFTGRLVLVDSGGLGAEVNPLLRLCALPGSELVMPLVCNPRVHGWATSLRRVLDRLPVSLPAGFDEVGRSYASLAESDTRTAFIHTLRSGVDVFGQRIDARDRLHLAEALPTMIVWGARDRIIPLRHGTEASDLIPGSRLEVFPDAGHFPHVEDPDRFARIVREFLAETEPARVSASDFRERVVSAAPRTVAREPRRAG